MVDTGHLASQNLRTFREDGVLRLPQVVDDHDVSAVRRQFWTEIEQSFGIHQEDAETWYSNPHMPIGGSRARRLSGMNPIMDALRADNRLDTAQAAIQHAIDATFGAGRWEPLDRWYSLLSFPGTRSAWSIPRNSWHSDEPIVVSDDEPWTIFAFLFLDRVERETGPTLAVTGSHRRGEILAEVAGVNDELQVRAFEDVNHDLVADPASVRLLPIGELLPGLAATDEWFGELVAGDAREPRRYDLMHAGTSHRGITSRVVELSGEAGDVVLFDPRCLHTASANVSAHPRQVLRLDFRRLTAFPE